MPNAPELSVYVRATDTRITALLIGVPITTRPVTRDLTAFVSPTAINVRIRPDLIYVFLV